MSDLDISNECGYPLRLTLSVEPKDAEKLRAMIMERSLFDPERSIGRDDRVHFPILVHGRILMNDLERGLKKNGIVALVSHDTSLTPPRTIRENPFLKILNQLRAKLGPEEIEKLPERWEMLGDCLVLDLPESLESNKEMITSTYMRVLGARFAVGRSKVSGELRMPDPTVLVPPEDGEYKVVHNENGVKFMLDPRKVIFSPGNVNERIRAASLLEDVPHLGNVQKKDPGRREELILDMFAGIGYFSLPVAFHSHPVRIVAVEKNPAAFLFLRKNISLNGVEDVVVPILGDNRKCAPSGTFDRVIMGYVGGTIGFLPHGLSYLRSEGGVIHLHDTVGVEIGPEGLMSRVDRTASDLGWKAEMVRSGIVKSYAPRVQHIVLDLYLHRDRPD